MLLELGSDKWKPQRTLGLERQCLSSSPSYPFIYLRSLESLWMAAKVHSLQVKQTAFFKNFTFTIF